VFEKRDSGVLHCVSNLVKERSFPGMHLILRLFNFSIEHFWILFMQVSQKLFEALETGIVDWDD
jgi:hypothetical protein